MFDALYVGATGMRGQQLQIDTIAHNLANLNTPGFRREVVTFDEVSAALSASAATGVLQNPSASLMARGAGVSAGVTLSSVAGELKQTGEPFDVAIDGPGFIEVTRADGTPAYTRSGKLKINTDGFLATTDGSPLSANLAIPADTRQIMIGPDGKVTALVGESTEPVEVGQIEIATFQNPAALQAAGANLYTAPAAAGEPQIAAPGESGLGTLKQGFVESSNVQLADELVTLMLAQRAFEMNSRVVQAADQMASITNSLYR
jgi:flagellar basal-body rod protein FlgG